MTDSNEGNGSLTNLVKLLVDNGLILGSSASLGGVTLGPPGVVLGAALGGLTMLLEENALLRSALMVGSATAVGGVLFGPDGLAAGATTSSLFSLLRSIPSVSVPVTAISVTAALVAVLGHQAIGRHMVEFTRNLINLLRSLAERLTQTSRPLEPQRASLI